MTFSTILNIRPLILAGSFVVSSAYATVTGFNTDPGGALWNRGDANTGFAVWDRFPTWQFADAVPSSTFGITLPGFSQLSPFLTGAAGGGLYNVLGAAGNPGQPVPDNDGTNPGTNGDIVLGGGNNLSFAFEGEVSFTIRGIVLQIKRPGSTGTMVGHYTPVLSINGGPGIPFDGSSLSSGTGDTASEAGTYAVTSYFWNSSLESLSQEATNSFIITASAAGTHRGVDGFELDVSSTTVVPEPTSVITLLAGFGALGLLRRRKAA